MGHWWLEAGGSVELWVTLGANEDYNMPSRNEPCAFAVAIDRPGEATVSPALLLFGAGTFGQNHPITVTGMPDGVVDGDMRFNVTIW